MVWSRSIDEKNKTTQERDKSVKLKREPSARPPNSPYTIMIQMYYLLLNKSCYGERFFYYFGAKNYS